MSTSSTSTVTSLPTSTTALGWSMCFQESSETCTRPSTPPRSTNAPKLTIEETTPGRTWPLARVCRKVERTSDRSEEHTSELQSRGHLVCRLLLEKKKSR